MPFKAKKNSGWRSLKFTRMFIQHFSDVRVHSFISTGPKTGSATEQIAVIIVRIPGKLAKKLIEAAIIPEQITSPKTLKTDQLLQTITGLDIEIKKVEKSPVIEHKTNKTVDRTILKPTNNKKISI